MIRAQSWLLFTNPFSPLVPQIITINMYRVLGYGGTLVRHLPKIWKSEFWKTFRAENIYNIYLLFRVRIHILVSLQICKNIVSIWFRPYTRLTLRVVSVFLFGNKSGLKKNSRPENWALSKQKWRTELFVLVVLTIPSVTYIVWNWLIKMPPIR